MPLTILLTGFGPFPGAPFNPTGPLVRELVRRGHTGLGHPRRVAHVFSTSYADVDRELPLLIARERPDILLMFGLATHSRHIRIETWARNALSRAHPDASGQQPTSATIVADGPVGRRLPVPAQRLVAAVRATGGRAILSRNAGSYLCNYLCWRASEAATRPGGPRLVSFIHVPLVPRRLLFGSRDAPLAFDDLVQAGEAIVAAMVAAARTRR